jgi:phosphatidylglycerophosphate synthase
VSNSIPKKGLRKKYEAIFAPFGKFLANTWITPNMISILSVGASVCSCAAYAVGPSVGASLGLLVGTFLLGVSSLLDMMDGSLARARGIAGYFGALLDRTLDRVSEFFFLLGIMIGGYVIPELVFFCFEGMILASYVRSTAELRGGLNMNSTQCVFERKEKLTLLAVGCLLEILLIEDILSELWFSTDFGILSIIVLIIGIASNISAFQRLLFARKFYANTEKHQ